MRPGYLAVLTALATSALSANVIQRPRCPGRPLVRKADTQTSNRKQALLEKSLKRKARTS